ncbi:MAG: SdpI family protein [Bacteroidota bacterium]|nr:SdpI family protein [Bacteroidota bacterium]
MKKFTYIDLAALLIWLIPVIYLFFVYASLPETVPMHYGMDGKVNRYGNKSELITLVAIMLGTQLFVYLLLRFLPGIDPKKQVKSGEGTFQKLALGIVFFISALVIAIIFSTAHKGIKIDKLILPLTGLLFAFMGNIMHSIKPNYFAGIRTPWTLESEDTWRVTHRLAGKLWFVGGIILTVLTLLLPPEAATVVFMCGVGIIVFIPVIYSYIYFKKHQPDQNS